MSKEKMKKPIFKWALAGVELALLVFAVAMNTKYGFNPVPWLPLVSWAAIWTLLGQRKTRWP